MLEGRRRDEGRRAGRTSSPDFLRTIWGFRKNSSSDSSSDPVNEFPADLLMTRFGSVADRVWLNLLEPVARASKEPVLKLWCIPSAIALACAGRTRRSPASGLTSVFVGELDLCCGIWLIASCRAFRFSIWRPRTSGSSSSLEDSGGETGGESIAPAGILRSSVTGGGDCRTLTLVTMPFKSSDVASGVGWSALASEPIADCVRRCLVRYEVERGRAGRGLVFVCPWKDGLRLTSGETGAEEAGDRWEGGVYGIPPVEV